MSTESRCYPSEICFQCGNQFGKPLHGHVVGSWMGKCGWCGAEGAVCAPRDYRYPEFTGKPPEGWDKE